MGAHPARVVVIEDEPLVRDAVAAALAGDGLVVAAFSDHVDPAVVLGESPDLAVIDVMLPHGDGVDLARRLRPLRDIPIIFVTARDTMADRMTGFGVGADDYLTKPFALEELLA